MKIFVLLAFALLVPRLSNGEPVVYPVRWEIIEPGKATKHVEQRLKTETFTFTGQLPEERLKARQKEWSVFLSKLQAGDELWFYRDRETTERQQGFVILRVGKTIDKFVLIDAGTAPTEENAVKHSKESR